MNIFRFTDYRSLLKSAIETKKDLAPSFTYSYLADQVKVQRSFLTHVLKGRANLSADQTYLICEVLEFDHQQREYVQLLVERDRTQITKRKKELWDRAKQIRSEEMKSGKVIAKRKSADDAPNFAFYYCNPYVPLVHMFLTIPKYRRNFDRIRNKLDLSETAFLRCVEILERCGLVEKRGNAYQVIEGDLHLPENSALSRTNAVMFRLKAIEHQQRNNNSDDYFFTASFAASDQTKDEIKTLYLEFLRKISSLVECATNDEVFQINFDLYAY